MRLYYTKHHKQYSALILVPVVINITKWHLKYLCICDAQCAVSSVVLCEFYLKAVTVTHGHS